MSPKTVTPEEAHTLMVEEGYLYLDVRTSLEFHQGHPAGAYNIPIMRRADRGMVPNLDFVREVEAHFTRESKLIVGCKMGGRSRKAVAVLSEAGFCDLLDQSAGFDGKRDPFGAVMEAGWKGRELPTEASPREGRGYESLQGEAR